MQTINQNQYPSIIARLVALLYELLLLMGVSCLAFIPAGAVAFLLREQTTARTILVGVIILLSWYLYFFSAWHKQEQTLAMRTWKIVLKSADGHRARPVQLQMRFVWASFFVLLIPMLVYLFMRNQGYPPMIAFGLAIMWWILPWGWGIIHPKKQFLYDVLAGTMLYRVDYQKQKSL